MLLLKSRFQLHPRRGGSWGKESKRNLGIRKAIWRRLILLVNYGRRSFIMLERKAMSVILNNLTGWVVSHFHVIVCRTYIHDITKCLVPSFFFAIAGFRYIQEILLDKSSGHQKKNIVISWFVISRFTVYNKQAAYNIVVSGTQTSPGCGRA